MGLQLLSSAKHLLTMFLMCHRGLSGKNIAGSPREYEMANRQNGTPSSVPPNTLYGDLVAELTYGELYNKVCTTQKTKIRIQNYTGVTKYAQFAGTTACIPVPPAIPRQVM